MAAKKRQVAKKRAGAAAPPPLTPAEQKYLEAFGELVEELKKKPEQRKDAPEERKLNPTVREVGERLGHKAEMAAQQPLKNLAEKGYLRDEWGWRVIGKELTPDGERWLAYRRGTS